MPSSADLRVRQGVSAVCGMLLGLSLMMHGAVHLTALWHTLADTVFNPAPSKHTPPPPLVTRMLAGAAPMLAMLFDPFPLIFSACVDAIRKAEETESLDVAFMLVPGTYYPGARSGDGSHHTAIARDISPFSCSPIRCKSSIDDQCGPLEACVQEQNSQSIYRAHDFSPVWKADIARDQTPSIAQEKPFIPTARCRAVTWLSWRVEQTHLKDKDQFGMGTEEWASRHPTSYAPWLAKARSRARSEAQALIRAGVHVLPQSSN